MAVLLLWIYYERTMQKVYEVRAIMDGLEDVKAGRTLDGEGRKNERWCGKADY